MPRRPDVHQHYDEEWDQWDQMYKDLDSGRPFTRRRHRKPLLLQRLDNAIHTDGHNHRENLRLLHQAELVLTRANLPPHNLPPSVSKRLKILARRDPDGPWLDYLPLDYRSVQIHLNSLPT